MTENSSKLLSYLERYNKKLIENSVEKVIEKVDEDFLLGVPQDAKDDGLNSTETEGVLIELTTLEPRLEPTYRRLYNEIKEKIYSIFTEEF